MPKRAPEHPTYEQAAEAAAAITRHSADAPRIAIILGSGLGGFVDRMSDAIFVPYADIPYFPVSTVPGHAGRLALGKVGGVSVVAMQGRFHFYEGYTPQQVVFPVRVMRLLVAEILVSDGSGRRSGSDAGGGIGHVTQGTIISACHSWRQQSTAGRERRALRCTLSLTGAYDSELAALAQEAATERGVHLYEGVYAMVSGPSFQSPAEIRFLRQAGADAVGMSTVPEVVAARHLNMRVAALCCVTNAALSDSEQGVEPKHEDVLAVAAAAGEDLRIAEGVIMRAGGAGLKVVRHTLFKRRALWRTTRRGTAPYSHPPGCDMRQKPFAPGRVIAQAHVPVVSVVVSSGQVWSNGSEPASASSVHRAPATGAPAFEMLPLIAIPWPGRGCPEMLMLTAN